MPPLQRNGLANEAQGSPASSVQPVSVVYSALSFAGSTVNSSRSATAIGMRVALRSTADGP